MICQQITVVRVDEKCAAVIDRLKAVRTGGAHTSRRPHKLLLLLAFVRLYRAAPRRSRYVVLGEELCSAFNAVVQECFPNARPRAILIEYPFFHLTRDGVWHLKIVPGKESEFATYRDSPNVRLTHRRLRETVESGYLEEIIDRCLRDGK